MQQILFAFFSFMTTMLWAETLTRTEIHYFRPFVSGEQKPNYEVKRQLTGKCISQSSIIVREDAWRCIAGAEILEPCFSKSQEVSELLCFTAPDHREAVLLKLEAALPHLQPIALDVSRTNPWRIELENGERCDALAGLAPIDGQLVNYRCHDGSLLLAHVQRCAQPWRILHKTASHLSPVDIHSAWF